MGKRVCTCRFAQIYGVITVQNAKNAIFCIFTLDGYIAVVLCFGQLESGYIPAERAAHLAGLENRRGDNLPIRYGERHGDTPNALTDLDLATDRSGVRVRARQAPKSGRREEGT